MTTEKRPRFTVIENKTHHEHLVQDDVNTNFHTNPIYEKLLKFRNLQEQQKKKFSVDDLFKLC